jgi:hypothetical protein
MSREKSLFVACRVAGFGAIATLLMAAPVSAAETRSYVVSWFHFATFASDADCPTGLNPSADVFFRRLYKELGNTPEQIEKMMANFPNGGGGGGNGNIGQRGRIDGKPANVYLNPTSEPDPNIKLAVGKVGYGFNLDGKDGPNSFVDPETGEKGIDNQLHRALGCTGSLRGTPKARPTHPAIQWDMTRDNMAAWLIQISGIDDPQNDDDVEVEITRAIEPIIRDMSGEPQRDMTFRVEGNPRMQNRAHAKIKNGRLTTDAFDFYMIGDPFSLPEYEFKNAKLRFDLKPDGSISGILGGYEPWEPIYFSWAIAGGINELNLSIDVPGLYYALRKMADANPDPKTGINMSISASWKIEAVPAFIAKDTKTVAQAH